jgi:hypothetical protein
MSNRIKVDECAIIDIKDLPPFERSYTDQEFLLSRLYPGRKIQGTGPRVADLRVTWPTGEWQRVNVKAVLTFPNYGGTRQWFECPGCQRRVRKLYAPDPASDFKCRLCYRLLYRSQYQRPPMPVEKWIDMLIDREFQERMRNDAGVQLCEELLRLEIDRGSGQHL